MKPYNNKEEMKISSQENIEHIGHILHEKILSKFQKSEKRNQLRKFFSLMTLDKLL